MAKLSKQLTGRFIALFLFTGIFVALAFGQMGLFKTGEIPFPSQNILYVSEVSTDSNNFYGTLEQIAENDNLRLYRSVVDKGESKGFVFGQLPKTSKERWTKNSETLEALPLIGEYFIEGKMSQKSLDSLEKIKVKSVIAPTGWQGVVGDLFLGWTIRTTTFYMSLLLFAVTIYALKMAKVKKAMIARTLGVKVIAITVELLSLLFSFVCWSLLVIALSNYSGTMLLTSFIFLLAFILASVLLVYLFVQFLFWSFIRTSQISGILKNKIVNKPFNYLWLLIIALSIGTMTQVISQAKEEYDLAQNRQIALKKWEKISDFSKLDVKFSELMMNMPEQQQTKEEEEARKKALTAYVLGWQDFYDSFSDDDELFLERPDDIDFLQIDGETTPAEDFKNPGKIVDLQSKWIAKIWQVSPYVVKLSQELIEDNATIFTNNKAVTVYIPEKYRASQAEILPPITSHFVDSGLTEEDFEVKIISNDFKMFVPILSEITNREQLEVIAEDCVIAQYNVKKFPHNTKATWALSDNFQQGLYRQDKLPAAIKNSVVQGEILNFSNAFDILENYQKESTSQMKRAIFTSIALFVAQIVVLFEFVKLRLALKAQKICVSQLFGISPKIDYLKIFCLLVVAIFSGLAFAVYKGANLNMVLLSGTSYLLMVILVMLVAAYQFKKKRLSILKGEIL
ncbi:ABC transporter permease [Lactococcus hodotermopsidis]|uniref:ABC transporter permease n=1 Tax=Pseudolactococcus hodotermopsidis TaxID=2709157 RepID=A0A6A0BE13_9LACT|nr:hypothetical protein [Lactococcus hodotermopsidis]GFH43046.1 ABC transporter permease [Lactococcus hodotermopsidis]